ncbi:MAG TPA: hypothetical protein VIY49_07805 [Bryobacteraceae bacterium]
MPIDIGSGPPGWTYDQTRTGAVEGTYGGAPGLIEFVERAHECGLEVIIDKQYNHKDPEQDSRDQILPSMFTRSTKWGPGLSGKEAYSYPQILKLIGEELAFWAVHYGVDGFRLDATNRLPWEVHEQIAAFCRQIGDARGKPLYVVSEYAECEPPTGRRVPTDHQYTDETGRYLMRLLGLSKAAHVLSLPAERDSFMRPMLKAARRGWWYPDVERPPIGVRGSGRLTTLLWHHDWIGNRFGGERISDVVTFEQFKAIAVWQVLGQWTPLVFMGTEFYARTRWYFFTGHQDSSTKNNTSAYYEHASSGPVLAGGRFNEFRLEAREAGFRDAIAFSSDGSLDGIDWRAFREQSGARGRAYMDHASSETFWASKLDWRRRDNKQCAIERLFIALLQARADSRLIDGDPRNSQYKGWSESEHVFVLRRRDSDGREFIGLFNLGSDLVRISISAPGIDAAGCGQGFVVGMED